MKKVMKILAAVMASAMLAGVVGCAGAGDKGTKDPKKLVMGTNAAFPPFEYLEGDKVVGVDAEIMAAIAKEMGVELEISDMEFDSLPTALANGQIDCIAAGFTIKPDREETMDFSDTYYTASQSIIVTKDSTVKTSADLADKTIGVQTGTTGYYCALDLVPEANIKGFGNGMLAVEALTNGQVDAVIIDNNPAKAYYNENPDTLQLIEGQFADEEYAIAVKKDNATLLKNINDGLAKIKENGTYDEIIAKYIK